MSNAYKETIAASATGNTIWLGKHSKPSNISISCVVTGTITFETEVTFDGTIYFGVLASGTTNVMGTIAYPIAGIRTVSTAGTGSVTLTILEDS